MRKREKRNNSIDKEYTVEKFLNLISAEMAGAFDAAGYDSELGKVTVSNRPDLCEYQCNGAMAGAKRYHKAPIMIANDVAAKLQDSNVFSSAEAVKPGFLNLKIREDFIRLRRTQRCQTSSRRAPQKRRYRRGCKEDRQVSRRKSYRRYPSRRLGTSDGPCDHRGF